VAPDSNHRAPLWPLILGDALAYLAVTLAGFATHGELAAPPARFMATYLPFLAAWLFAAGAVGALDDRRAAQPRPLSRQNAGRLWRVAAAALLAAPLGAVVRGSVLGTPVLPIFVGVMAGVSLVTLLGWRAAYLLLRRRRL